MDRPGPPRTRRTPPGAAIPPSWPTRVELEALAKQWVPLRAPLALRRWSRISDGTTWSIGSSPDPLGAVTNDLKSVSCTSSTWCNSIGVYGGNGTNLPMAEIDVDSEWSLEPIPAVAGATNTQLQSVSCPSTTFCAAVGLSSSDIISAVAELWNGTSWSIVPAPSPGPFDELFAVSCSSPTSCVAVGSDGSNAGSSAPLAEVWDGTSWSVQPVGQPPGSATAQLDGVACISSTDCTAVGYDAATGAQPEALIENWDGSSWSMAPNGDNVDLLTGVSCTSATACVAVGSDYLDESQMFAESWDGTAWTVDRTQGHRRWFQLELNGVSCASATACTAVGYYEINIGNPRAVTEVWDGASWTIEKTAKIAPPPGLGGPQFAFGTALDSVSCPAAGTCRAVGDTTVFHIDQALAEAEG